MNFKIGYNFDCSLELRDKLNELNCAHAKDNKRVTEVYGSIRSHAALAARPDFRLPDISIESLAKHVDCLKILGITFSYTLNTIYPGTLRHMVEQDNFIKLLDELNEAGIRSFIVTHPLIAEFVHTHLPKSTICLSTIAHLDTVTQLKMYKKMMHVDKICLNLRHTRNFPFLRRIAEAASRHDVTLELMTNEFCSIGYHNSATHCLYRDSCYLAHAENHSKEDALLYDKFPMGHCIYGRSVDKHNWLRANFILPQWLHEYDDIGVHDFKITGRTASTDYIVGVLKAYMKERFDGNLLELWQQLQAIYGGKSTDHIIEQIDCSKLDGFIKHFSRDNHVCELEDCGVTCNYCKEYYDKDKLVKVPRP